MSVRKWLIVKNVIGSILMLSLCGCLAPASNINMVSLGMTKQQVIAVMGDPASTSAIQGKEYMNYSLAEDCQVSPVIGGKCLTTPYYIRLIEGKVDAYGRHGDFGTTQMTPQKIILEQTIESK
jgi:hypothetical protein